MPSSRKSRTWRKAKIKKYDKGASRVGINGNDDAAKWLRDNDPALRRSR